MPCGICWPFPSQEHIRWSSCAARLLSSSAGACVSLRARPRGVGAVRAMGPGNTGLDKWFDQQLHPENIDETDLNARLAQFPAMQWSTQDLLYRMPSQAMIRQAADGKINIPPNGTLHAVYENQIYRYQ